MKDVYGIYTVHDPCVHGYYNPCVCTLANTYPVLHHVRQKPRGLEGLRSRLGNYGARIRGLRYN
eukprot:1316560-Amorphochlora_amoeboformis.AAC.2